MSLSDYQSLSFDREALQAAYQSSLTNPASSATSSSRSHPSTFFGSSSASAETLDTDFGPRSTSTLSHHLKPGDNPHEQIVIPEPPNFAGVGAGHSLTSPGSPAHKAVQQVHQAALLSPVLGSGSPLQLRRSHEPPTPPERPSALPPSTFRPGESSRPPIGASRYSAMDVDGEGYDQRMSESGSTLQGSAKRRHLPPVPTNVPVPEPPAWEPDTKAHIPPDLIAPSVQNAYAQLSAPPPNLPPRRTQPVRQASLRGRSPSRSSRQGRMGFARPTVARGQTARDVVMADASATASAGPSQQAGPSSAMAGPASLGRTGDQIMTDEPAALDLPQASVESIPQYKPRRRAEQEVFLRSENKIPIWSTHYLDPCLRNSLYTVPHQVTNVTNIALSSLSSGPKTKYNTTTGAPIDGMARMAKDWFVKPDAKFMSEGGAVELGLAVIDAGGDGWGRDKGRKRARIEVETKSGGVKIDLIELDLDRQVDLRVESKTGDVLIFLPETFLGPIHVTSPTEPLLLPIMQPQCAPLAHPYETFFTTFVTPLGIADPKKAKSIEHQAAQRIQKYVPTSFRGQSDILDQVVGGFASHTRGEHSKVAVKSRGRVVIGYRETRDEEQGKGMGLKVGVEQGKGKKKRWWRGA